MDLARLAAGVLQQPAAAAAPVAFAADELVRYLGRIVGSSPARTTRERPSLPWLYLAPAASTLPAAALAVPAGAEWAIRPTDDGIVLTGTSPRALLAAVYGLLQAVGCRWSPRGAGEEHVPGLAEARRAPVSLEARPAFARRAYASDLITWHYSMPERLGERLPADLAFVDWMAKSGATGWLFIRHANDTQWTIPELAPALAARGLEVEGGGHALVELLPRGLFGAHPEYFPAAPDGTRSDLGNACVSSPEALAVIATRAHAAWAALPGARGLHLWGLDLMGGGWCGCAGCAPLTPSDQALRVCNTVADALGGQRIWHLAYHDTLAPPRRERPRATVWAEFAARERCYRHGLADPACATNARYRDALDRHLELFEGRVEVFEYYADAILFGGLAVPLTHVIASDLEHYARAGVQGVSCLTFGTYSLAAYGVNVEAFARGTLAPAAARAAAGAYCARRHGPAAHAMERHLAALEGAMSEVLTHGDVLLAPRDAATRAALARARAATAALRPPLAAAGVGPGLATERALLDYTHAALAAVDDWLAAGADVDAVERALAALAAAAAPVRALDPAESGTWGRYDLELTHHFYAAALRAR